jgi:hypothetical protein
MQLKVVHHGENSGSNAVLQRNRAVTTPVSRLFQPLLNPAYFTDIRPGREHVELPPTATFQSQDH